MTDLSIMPAGTRRAIMRRINREFGKMFFEPFFREDLMKPTGLKGD